MTLVLLLQEIFLSSVSTHPIFSVTENIISASSVIFCSSDVASPSPVPLPMHPISAEKNTTPSPTVSNQSDTAVSNYSSLILPVSPSVGMAKTSPLISPVSVTDSISKVCIFTTSTKSATTTRVMGSRVLTSAQGFTIL